MVAFGEGRGSVLICLASLLDNKLWKGWGPILTTHCTAQCLPRRTHSINADIMNSGPESLFYTPNPSL